MRQADALERIAPFLIEQRDGHPFRHGVEHGNRNRRAFAGARAADDRFQNRLIGAQARRDIDDRNTDARRRFRAAGHRREP